jgi:hypothetical protein
MEGTIDSGKESSPEPTPVPREAVEEPAPPPRAKVVTKGSFRRRPRRKYEPVFYINLLALIAFVLGILSLMLPWVHEESSGSGDFYGLPHFADDSDLRFGLSIGLLTVGSLLVLLVRFFGIVELSGVLLFAWALEGDFTGHTLGYVLGAMSTGFYVALVGGVLGTLSLVFRYALPVSDRFLTIVRSKDRRAYHVNFLSIAAAILGIVCIFLPWIVETYSFQYIDRTWTYDWSLLSMLSGVWGPLVICGAALFLLGSVSLFVTPFGGVGQLFGVLIYIYGVVLNLKEFHYARYGDAALSFGPGFLLGLVASIAAIASLAIARRLLVPVSLFSIRASDRPQMPPGPAEKPRAVVVSQIPWTLKKTLRLIALCVIAFLIIAAPIIVAYAAPLSELTVQVNNYDQELTARAVIYVDDEPAWTLTVPPSSQAMRSMRIQAGEHNIGVDYAIPGRTLEDMPDGQLDWSTSIKVKPLIGVDVVTDIGYYGWSVPVGDISISADSSRATVTFDGFTQYYNGQPQSNGVSWYDLDLLLTDGVHWASWTDFSSVDLVSAPPPAVWHYGPPRTLGITYVWLNVTDLAANGYANKGDFFTLETGNGSFDALSTYTLYVLASHELICKGVF